MCSSVVSVTLTNFVILFNVTVLLITMWGFPVWNTSWNIGPKWVFIVQQKSGNVQVTDVSDLDLIPKVTIT